MRVDVGDLEIAVYIGDNIWRIIFAIIFGIATWIVGCITILPVLGWIIYIIVMPYIAGRLVDFVSDKWMD